MSSPSETGGGTSRPTPNRPERGRIFPRYSTDDDVRRELDTHVAMRAEELVREGWSLADAEDEARRLLGNRASLERECVEVTRSHQRAMRRGWVVDAFIQDMRYGLRAVVSNPGFALVAVLTLALGVGANTAVFSVVRAVLLEPLPYAEADRLVAVREARRDGGTMAVAWANFVDWREQSPSFDGLFAYGASSTTVLGGVTPVTATVGLVSVDAWSVLGVAPIQGRLTSPPDHGADAPPVAVLSEGFWRNELGGRPVEDIVLEISGFSVDVVGVVPRSFDFPVGTDLWMPIELGGQSMSRSSHNWSVVGRLGIGYSVERAEEEIDGLTKRLVQDLDDDPDFLAAGARVDPLQDLIVGDARTPLLVLLAAAGLVLLIACTNLASTLLARGQGRARELAVRASLGAGRGRLIRQLVTESLVLASGGAVAGVLLAQGLVATLQRLGPDAVPRLGEVDIDGFVLLYAGVVAMATVVLFGLLPALRMSRGAARDALASGARGNAGERSVARWSVLVGGEVALALVLLVGSGLLVRSFRSLLAEDTGFDPSDVVSAPVTLSLIAYDELTDHVAFYDRVLEEIERSPAVSAAGVMSVVPLGGFVPNGRIELDGDLEKHAVARYVVASPGAFAALDVPLLQGRVFDRADTPDGRPVAIVSESFARQYWPGESPLGKQVTGGGMDNYWEDRAFAEVVGVVGDVSYRSLGEDDYPTVYFPHAQRPFRLRYGANLLVEAADGNPLGVAPLLRETIRRLDPDVPVDVSTQEDIVAGSVASREFSMLLLLGFAAIALSLAVVGIYGVVSYSVAQRRREMGIRLALGAEPGGVVQLVVRASMRVVVAGLLVGSIGAVLVGRVMREMLYGVAPSDPTAIVSGVVILGASALLASWIPAHLGTRVDPMTTMRSD